MLKIITGNYFIKK